MLSNKIALITGASSGIGLATVEKFLNEGATVIGVGPKTKEISNISGNFTFIECDVTNTYEIDKIHTLVEEKVGKLDSLVTVCDKSYNGSCADITSDLFDKASKHIVMSPMLFATKFSDLLHKSENPSITFDIPIAALMMEKNALSASLNTSLVSYARQCAPQFRPIRVNTVMYGIIKGHLITDEEVESYSKPEFLKLIPAKRLGETKDVANFNAFLASDKARYINSAAMQVDGGYYTLHARSMGSAI